MDLAALKTSLPQHPTEAAIAGGPCGWAAIREMFRPSPEVEFALEFIRTHRRHGEPAAWRAFEQATGVRPDSLIAVRLRRDLVHGEHIIVPRLGRFLNEHRHRLRRKEEADHIQDDTAEIRKGIRRFPSLDVSLEALRVAGQSHEEVLLERLPGALYVEKAQSPPGARIAGRAASAIREEGLERPDQPGLVVPLNHEIPVELAELASFIAREDLRRDAVRAGLSSKEQETFALLLDGLSSAEVAAELHRSASQVRQEKHRTLRKLRQYRQASGI